MLNQEPVTLVPVSGPVQVQGLLLSIAITTGSSGLGLMDPLLWDQQLLCQEALPADRLLRLLQWAVEGQHVPHRWLPLTENRKTHFRVNVSLLPLAAGTLFQEV